jgi:rod shape determining protein RodA
MSQHFKKIDWILVALVLLLVSFGLVSLHSSGGEQLLNFKKQVIWVSMGFFLMLIISFADYRILKNHRSPIIFLYLSTCLLLAGIFVFGVSIRGAGSWYRVGPISIEPVELAKITLILLLAKYFSMRHIEIYRFRHIFISGLYMILPTGLVLLQPDMGSTMIMMSIWFGIMVMAGIKVKHLVFLGISGIVLLFGAWNFVFQDFQKSRILSFINPDLDPLGASYNVLQSMIAIGSGGIWGRGLGEGSQTQLGFLPEAQTDFIYSSIVEEMGLIAGILLLACFLLFFRRIMDLSKKANNNFARLVAGGFSVMLIAHIFVNLGMTMGLLPVTGIPLPFISYGGSSLLSLFVMLGVIQSIKAN